MQKFPENSATIHKKRSYTTIKLDSFQGHKDGSTYANHINRRKVKNRIIISIEREKALDKIQHPFMIKRPKKKKTLTKMCKEGTYLNMKKLFMTEPQTK